MYFVNDAVDAERTGSTAQVPAAGGLRGSERNHALALAAGCVLLAGVLVAAVSLLISDYGLALAVTAYLATSFLYSFGSSICR
ncbi:hypothetical protein GXW82_06855 [Streptacidiphilus sp. 4-A2]|nr:hypothetical protein [Streptacidiphilus sp. 4-A2]